MKLHHLTEEEIADRARKLAEGVREINEIEADKKETAKLFSDRLKEKREEVAKLSAAVETGTEWRSDQLSIFRDESAA